MTTRLEDPRRVPFARREPRLLTDLLAPTKDPVQLAVVEVGQDDTARQYTYGHLDRAADEVASELQRRGYGRGSRIGVLARNSVRFYAVLFGALRAGCTLVPINPRAGRETIEFICRDAGIELLYVDEASFATAPGGIERIQIESLSISPTAERSPTTTPVAPSDPALILYTSGSTGHPKGVVLSHGSQAAIIQGYLQPALADLFSLGPCIVAAPLFHMNALVFSGIALQFHGRIILLERFSAPQFIAAIKRYRVAVLSGVPTMIALMAQEREALDAADLSSVRLVLIGSAPLSDAVLAQTRTLFSQATILNGYGTTETGAGYLGPHPQGKPRPPMSLGYPQPHADLRLVGGHDPSQGVLEVRSPTNMTGYLNRPDLNHVKIRDGWVNTGDIMRRDEDGFFYFVGRTDDMFVCSGENTYPGEVERVLERHPAVLEVCIVPVEDHIRGAMPVAFVVRRPDVTTSERELKEYVLARASPHMHPRHIWFVERMPLSGTNKIDRKELAMRAATLVERSAGDGRAA